MTRKCQYCDGEFRTRSATICPHCGQELGGPIEAKIKSGVWIVVLIIVLLMIAGYITQ